MAVQQYNRKASLIVGKSDGNAIDLSELRFRFTVKRGDIQTPNTAEIRVYNLSDETADQIRQLQPTPEFTRVVLQAGYAGNYGVIFDGEIKQIRRGRESETDTYLDISAADGDSAYNFSVMALSLAAGATNVGCVEAILKGMADRGIQAGYIPAFDNDQPKLRGKVLYGMARDELRKVGKNTSTQWSIQDGKLVMIPETAYLPGEAVVLTSETGMVGLPEQTQNGIKIKALLNPALKIGQAVKIDNKSVQQYRYGMGLSNQVSNQWAQQVLKTNADGLYYVMIADHSGDTRGNEWYSNLLCLAIDAIPPQGYLQQSAVNSQTGWIKRYG